MEPGFIEERLEKARERRNQLKQKLQSSPSGVTRKRKPLQEDLSANTISTDIASQEVTEIEKQEGKRHRSSTNLGSDKPLCSASNSKPAVLNPTQDATDSSKAKPVSLTTRQSEIATEVPIPPSSRRGRLAKLAQQINGWEDDLSHPQIRREPSPKKQWQPPVSKPMAPEPSKAADSARPPKPPRALNSRENSPVVATRIATRCSPRTVKQAAGNEIDAFKFASQQKAETEMSAPKSVPAQISTSGTSARPIAPVAKTPTPRQLRTGASDSDSDPAQKPVADRFKIWEKKAGDSLTPLRSANPIPAGRTPSFTNAAGTTASPNGSACLPTNQDRAARRRSRSATPSTSFTRAQATPPQQQTPRQGTAPWQNKSQTPKPAAANKQDDNWNKRQEQAFQQAPMSARKMAWEAKIAEQQTVASEHNRIMYRTRSATRLDSNQKQDAEKSLAQGQEKVYDPAVRAKQEREKELRALKSRFNDKGLLQSEHGPVKSNRRSRSPGNPLLHSTESVKSEDQEYFTASEVDNITADEAEVPKMSPKQAAVEPLVTMRGLGKKQVSFEGDRKQTPDKRPPRRSSCKIPSLGYESSSDEGTPVSNLPIPHIFATSKMNTEPSPNKIPRLADDTSDSLDSRQQTSVSSLASTCSGESYSCDREQADAGSEIDDLLDEAMSDSMDDTVQAPSPPNRTAQPSRCSPQPSFRSPQPSLHPPQPSRRSPRLAAASPRKRTSGAMLHSIDSYRKNTKSMAKLGHPARQPVVSPYDYSSTTVDSETDTGSVSSTVSDQDRRKRVKELQELVQQEQNVIIQTSNALNQCCMSGSSFAGSKEQVECNRLLLIACQRRQAYLSEIEKIKANPNHVERRHGKGSLTISDLQLPLKRDFVKKMGTPEDTSVHYFLLIVRNGAQVIVSQMVSSHECSRGVLHFPNLIKLNDIMNDFKYELEIYSMQVSREVRATPNKKDKKRQATQRSKSWYMTANVRRRSEGAPTPAPRAGRDGSQVGGSMSVRTTNFTHISSLMITMDCVKHTGFKLARVPYLSPLQGTVHMTLRCTMEANVAHRGFINMFEDVGGFGAWHRRWCVLNDNKVAFWKYPDDERVKEPIGLINLKDCVTKEIGLVSRDKCARPNTIELLVQNRIPSSRGGDKIVHEQHWFGMDTKPDRIEWCGKLNEALANVRQWYSDAARPVKPYQAPL